MSDGAASLEGLHKSFGKLEVLRGIDLAVAEHEVVCLIGASGLGQVDAAPLRQPARADRRGADLRRRRGDHRARRRREPRAARDRDRLPVVQPLPAHDRARERDARAAEGAAACSRAEAERRGRRAARALRARRQAATTTPTGFPAGSSSASRSSARWRCSRELLLLDEVTSALDPELVAEVLDVIRELAAGGMTMLIATHEMGFARDVANRVCFLDDGRDPRAGPARADLRRAARGAHAAVPPADRRRRAPLARQAGFRRAESCG